MNYSNKKKRKNKKVSTLRACISRKYIFCKQDTDTYTGAKPF